MPNPPTTPPPTYTPDPTEIEPTLASIQTHVFTPICTACHAGAAAPQGLRLEAGVSYGMLVNVPSVGVPSIDRVEPGSPGNSFLIHKLEGTQAAGARMPFGGPYLDAQTIAIIRQWITDGALASSAPGKVSPPAKVAGTWPTPDARLPRPFPQVILVFDGELDVASVHTGSVRVLKLDAVNPATLEPVVLHDARVTVASRTPTTLRVTLPDGDWTTGGYEIQVFGLGASQVVDIAGRPIDGDGDGLSGGDFVLQFSVSAGAQ